MSLPFNKYINVKDRVCIGYFGPADEHLVQLRALRPNIESTFPGIEVYLSGKDASLNHFKSQPRLVPLSLLKSQRREFGMVYELVRDMESHPVEQFCESLGIPLALKVIRKDKTRRCVICPNGEQPTRDLTSDQIQETMRIAKDRGFRTEFGDDVSEAGWVVGVECPALYEAALSGIETSLVPDRGWDLIFPKTVPWI